jgi:hypothetical protein
VNEMPAFAGIVVHPRLSRRELYPGQLEQIISVIGTSGHQLFKIKTGAG